MSGASFEENIKYSCKWYQIQGMALIHKIPTPWAVNYDKVHKRVKSAHPEEKSSVDFEGVWRGWSIAIEAKSTREENRFDLKNIKEHQMDYLFLHQKQGGISFFLMEFALLGEVYFVWYDQVKQWWKEMKKGGRKSIPYDWIQKNCKLVPCKRTSVDFIDVLSKEEWV